jgi:SSS family transporter
MSIIDWLVLSFTLLAIVVYGSWKTRKNNNLESYLKGNNEEKWFTIGLSIMATQASAITFLSTTGQGYESGMGFVQFYFGLPIAMIIVSAFFLPIYYRLRVYTAYEYLEQRFDYRMRSVTAGIFLLSRGLAAGITIYAPSIILSSLLGWNLQFTCIALGALVIIYTVSGGSRAVSLTQKWQMGVIMGGMVVAFYYVLDSLPVGMGFLDAFEVAGNLGKMEVIDTSINYESRYTIWSGLTGGLFLSLSYFGTDQSQVQRYLGGKTLRESRLGLLFNGVFKIPMQFFILLVGVMIFVSFQFNQPPIIFNPSNTTVSVDMYPELTEMENRYKTVFDEKKELLLAKGEMEEVHALQVQQDNIRNQYKKSLNELDLDYVQKDGDYIFLYFILNYLPHGLIGLLLAVILSAAMSSTSGELNALSSTSTIDFYKRLNKQTHSDVQEMKISKWLTVIWGVVAIFVALVANLFENLIELVNIIGSLFYGTILGIFLVAFFIKKVKSKAIFIATIIGQTTVITLHILTVTKVIELGYLWYNVIGSVLVILSAVLIQMGMKNEQNGTLDVDTNTKTQLN